MYSEQDILGDIATSERLLQDLFIDLRKKVNYWSKITGQTPQARMGYIGQHLVSMITGFRGGKSGARGKDLVIDNNSSFGEIKTCYKVDQLGECSNCKNKVSSLESYCGVCYSENILRKDDSKWLISIRDSIEFENILEPKYYYFVLFEFEDITNISNNTIVVSIWEVNPKCKGFKYCMFDYYLNIKNNAPFNMWPHQLKFELTQPKLIYESKIYSNDTIKTIIHPQKNNTHFRELSNLRNYSKATTLTVYNIIDVILKLEPTFKYENHYTKLHLLDKLETLRRYYNISNSELCDLLSDSIYLSKINYNLLPDKLKLEY